MNENKIEKGQTVYVVPYSTLSNNYNREKPIEEQVIECEITKVAKKYFYAEEKNKSKYQREFCFEKEPDKQYKGHKEKSGDYTPHYKAHKTFEEAVEPFLANHLKYKIINALQYKQFTYQQLKEIEEILNLDKKKK